MNIFAVANQKGGVGKTTSTANLAAGLSRQGRRVLLLDLDPQANLTRGLGLWQDAPPPRTAYDVLCEAAAISEVLVERALPGAEHPLHVVPATLGLSSAEIKLVAMFGRESLLREAFERVDGYDYCLIDCPPSLGLLTINALVAANFVLLPVQAEYFAMAGAAQITEALTMVRKLNPDLEIGGAFVTLFDQRRRVHEEGLAELEAFFGPRLLQTRIRVDTKLSEAPTHGQTIFEYVPRSRGAEDYARLAEEFAARFAA